MNPQMQKLTDDVAAVKTVAESATTALAGIKAQLDAAIAANDPAALQALSESLEATTSALSAAIVANTPAAPPATT